MEKLRAMREKAQTILADPDLFVPRAQNSSRPSRRGRVERDLAAAEDRFRQELEMLREELEG
ncbi:MAG: hypothetical protein U1E30_03030 [Rhodoblastus sp.]